MPCNYKVTALVVAVLTIVFAGSNLFKLMKETDEDIKRFICYHPKHDDHKDMLHRKHKDQVRSHTTEEEEESFADKIKHGRDEEERKDEYSMKIARENKCRQGISKRQMKGFRLMGTIGIVLSALSLFTCALVLFTVTGNDEKNRSRRKLVLPYIIIHLLIIAFEIFTGIYAAHLIHRIVILPIILISLSVIMLACYIVVMVGHYRVLGKVQVDKSVKEMFDYSIMPEEKDASEA